MEMNLINFAFTDTARKQGFNTSGMTTVVTSDGFAMLTKVEFLDDGLWMMGALSAIGENARKEDGTHFTAFLVARGDSSLVVKTRKEVRHPIEAGIPTEWAEFIHSGWKIVPSSWECGCQFAWMSPRPSGAHMMYGCISHCRPKADTPARQGEVSTA